MNQKWKKNRLKFKGLTLSIVENLHFWTLFPIEKTFYWTIKSCFFSGNNYMIDTKGFGITKFKHDVDVYRILGMETSMSRLNLG